MPFRFSRLFLSGLFLVVLTPRGCIERFYPDEDELKAGLLVINAHLTSQPDMQYIEVSRSVSLISPSWVPENGCLIELIRDDGLVRIFEEESPGVYGCGLDQSFLKTGGTFMLHLITAGGQEYQSDLEILHPAPDIDSIYYEVERVTYENRSDTISGIRFYIDFTYDDADYQYLRWELTETYEFHNPDMKGFVLDLDMTLKELTDTNNYKVCYITNPLSEIHSMPLSTLEFGIYVRKPFTFVPNDLLNQKLKHKYSLQVEQYSMGEAAFHYWNELKKSSQEQGFLFDKQPALLQANIHNVNDPDEVILGFFSMAGRSEKRGFAENPEGLDMSLYKWYCFPEPKGPGGMISLDRLPMYFAEAWRDGERSFAEVNKHCVDCRAYKNSSHIAPDFW